MYSRPSSHSDKLGFTLIELLVSITAGTLIMIGTLNIFSLARTSLEKGNHRAEATQNARIALEHIARDLRQADEIVTALPETATDPLLPPPANLEFRDGHDPETLTYLRYHLAENRLHRERSYYAFSADPAIRVTHNLRDASGNPPTKTILDDLAIAEGVESIEFWGEGVLSIQITTRRGSTRVTIPTSIFGRNLIGS